MKKLLNIFVMVLLPLFVGCSTDNVDWDTVPTPEVNHKVQIAGNIDQHDATRVDDSGFCAGDAVGIYLVNYDGEQPGTLLVEQNQADNVKFTLGEDGTWTSEYDIFYKDNDTKVDFYGYYPYSTPTAIEDYPFEVAKDQTTPAEHGQMAAYEASDFLWAKREKITPTESKINLLFQHKMAAARVRFVQGEGWESEAEFAAVKKEVLITSTIRKATINLSTGVVTPTGDMPLDGIMPVKDGDDYRAIVVPQTVEAGENVLVVTIDGLPRQYVRSENTEYLPGKITTFDLSVKKSAAAGEYEVEIVGVSITAWEADNVAHQDDAREYVVVHNPGAGRLERTMVDRLEMDVTAVKNLKITGYLGYEDYLFMRDKMTSLMRLNLREVESKIGGVYKIPFGAFEYKKTLIKCVLPEKLEHIEDNAFYNTSLTGTVQLPEGLKYVEGFSGTKITNIQFPSTLEEIRDYAFEDCNSLMCELVLPQSLKRIGECAFFSSAIRGNLVLPEGLEYIGYAAFKDCYDLTGSLTIPSSIHTISPQAFASCGFTGNLTLPMGLTDIGYSAFSSAQFKGELNIPSTVTSIGHDAFYRTNFSGNLILPKELIVLEREAFSHCQRLSGIVEIPENIVVIPSKLFYDCKNLEGVVFHKNVEVIESEAFAECYYMSSIVSKAKNPPIIDSDAFEGVAKDNFTLEVPEESIRKYQFATGWDEFKRISAYRDFSISRNLMRVLNDSHSKTLVLRAPAGEAWSVESAPEWVTVTPSSGIGKTDVTITINEMAAGETGTFKAETVQPNGVISEATYAGRGGEVVFLLDDKDCRVRTTVEQYDYRYGDGDLITLQTKGVGNGVNIVIMGDCFDAKDIADGKYLKAMQDAYTYFFDIEPYLTYKDYFNVYAVVGMSADSGIGTVNTIREARFGSQYSLNTEIEPNFNTVFAGACVAPINDNVATTLIILIENSNEYGSAIGLWGDGSAVALVPMSTDPAPYDFRGLIHHEAGGHGFGKLADECIYHNAFIQDCTCPCCNHSKEINEMKYCGFYSNISLTGDIHRVPWAHMIYDPQYSNVVDIYEGAYMHTRGVYRSEATSCMNNNIAYYNAISREAIIKRIMKYAGKEYSYEAFKAKDHESLPQTATTFGTRVWEDAVVKASVQRDHREPKFMGEKPKFNKDKF